MKRQCILLLILLIPSMAEAFVQGSDGIVSIEAERYQENTGMGGHEWSLDTTHAGYSGSGAMIAEPNVGANVNTGFAAESPRLDFRVDFVKTGIHYIWIRGWGASEADDSVHVGIDGAAVDLSDRITFLPLGDWIWSRTTMDGVIATIDIPSPGRHIINVWMREDGFILDKLVLSPDPSFIAVGMGPPESQEQTLPLEFRFEINGTIRLIPMEPK